jgi:hypothetical protein
MDGVRALARGRNHPLGDNTSATGGYLLPDAQPAYPGGLTFKKFLQTVFVGVSGLPGDLVRPRWQRNPPKQPDVEVNWLAIGLTENKGDTYSYNGTNLDGSNITQRFEALEIQCSFYGPDADDNASLVRDNLQLPQNLETMKTGRLDMVSCSSIMRMPELVNERWIERSDMTVYLRREIKRNYQVFTMQSARGTIASDTGKTVAWNAKA